MIINSEKEVDFYKYCKTCEHEKINGDEEPCNECLTNPTNTYSHKPINYKEK